MNATSDFVFPRWTNQIRNLIAVGAAGGALYAATIVSFGFSPQALSVGYQPTQPVPYSHVIHAGKLGLDCRYCHTGVEVSAHALVPPTQTCMGCHTNILPESEKLVKVRESAATGKPIQWFKIHDLPDYVYFNHSAHVRRGVGCASCHGRIDKMDVVYQSEPLSMSWCLDCHREPERKLRPLDRITDMEWSLSEKEQLELGAKLRKEYHINPSMDCSTCHR